MVDDATTPAAASASDTPATQTLSGEVLASQTQASEGPASQTQASEVSPSPETAAAVAPGATLSAATPGATLTEKIHALHAAHFGGSELAAHTSLWNLVFAFKQAVVRLVEEAAAAIEAKI